MEIIDEIYNDIPGFEGLYQASNLGNVRSLERIRERSYKKKKSDFVKISGRVLKPVKTTRGYYHLTIFDINKKRFQIKIHQLVMWAFVGKQNMEINHINGIKSDNRLANLEYCTRSYNISHSFKTGLRHPRDIRGNKNIMAKLSDDNIRHIRSLLNDRHNQKYIATMFEVSCASISNIKRNKTWKHIK